MSIMSRENLQLILEGVLRSRNVYFQPPSNLKLKYPCIVYSMDRVATLTANNTVYKIDHYYAITLITTNADNDIVDKIIKLPFCTFDRSYVSDGLYHYSFSLYYK